MQSRFTTTSWSKIQAARDAPSAEARQALEALCRLYWYPLYAFVRRLGHDADGARDLTQSYFAELLEKGYLEDYDPARGRFRVFLKASLKNFLSKQRDKERTWKRGGRTEVLSLDTPDVESRYQHEPVDRMNARGNLRTTVGAHGPRARARTAPQGAGGDRPGDGSSRSLEGFLTGLETMTPYREVAAELGHRKAS